MATPVNAETFLPTLLADYLEDQRAALGLPDALSIYPWPWLGDMERPFIGIEASTFRFDRHPATQHFEVSIMLDYGVDGEPALHETAAQAKTRRDAMLAAENAILSKVRAAFALKTGQQVTFTSAVDSLFTWIGNRAAAEDGWALEEFIVAGGGGSIGYDADKRIRRRITNYTARIMTNEFTV